MAEHCGVGDGLKKEGSYFSTEGDSRVGMWTCTPDASGVFFLCHTGIERSGSTPHSGNVSGAYDDGASGLADVACVSRVPLCLYADPRVMLSPAIQPV